MHSIISNFAHTTATESHRLTETITSPASISSKAAHTKQPKSQLAVQMSAWEPLLWPPASKKPVHNQVFLCEPQLTNSMLQQQGKLHM
jgi:hypothetical protein